jgi:hypothetical protein
MPWTSSFPLRWGHRRVSERCLEHAFPTDFQWGDSVTFSCLDLYFSWDFVGRKGVERQGSGERRELPV